MDSETIIEDANSVEVLQRLDITIGPKNKCLCPYHVGYGKKPTVEHDFGSCGIVERGNWKGIHCFVCGESWSLQRLVMDKIGCSYPEALNFIYGKNVKIQFSPENRTKGHGRSFNGTSYSAEEGSELTEYRVSGKGFKNIDEFLNNSPYCKGTVPESVVFADEGIAINGLPIETKKYFYDILIAELEEAIEIEPKNRKEFMIRREKIKQLEKIRKYLSP